MEEEIRMDLSTQVHLIGLAEARRERLIREGYEYYVDPATFEWVFRRPIK